MEIHDSHMVAPSSSVHVVGAFIAVVMRQGLAKELTNEEINSFRFAHLAEDTRVKGTWKECVNCL